MKEGQNPDSTSLMPVEDFDNDTGADTEIVSEGGATQPEFASKDIGNKATVEYFSNVEGGKKNQEKVMRRRTHATRKTLQVVLACAIGAVVIVAIIFVVLNLTGSKIGKRTGEQIPEDPSVLLVRAYEEAYKTGEYKDGLIYMNNMILDMKDNGYGNDKIIPALIYRAEFAYDAGGGSVAIDELLDIEESYDLTDKQKYLLYIVLASLYRKSGNDQYADSYNNKAEAIGLKYNKPLLEGTEAPEGAVTTENEDVWSESNEESWKVEHGEQ